LQRESPLLDVLPRGQATGPLSPRRSPILNFCSRRVPMSAWFTPPVSAAVARTRRSLRRDRWLGAAAGDPARHSEAADKRRCLADRAGDHADSWPAATRLAFVPAKPDLERAPSVFLKRHEDARNSKIRRDEGCTRTVFSCPRPLPIKETVRPICNGTDLKVRKLVVLGNRAICGSGVGEMASVPPSGARPPATDML
jgi:hypothetical protein